MRITTSISVIEAVYRALKRPLPRSSPSAAADIIATAVADGWVDPADVENLIFASETRLGRPALRDLCADMDIAHLPATQRLYNCEAYMPAETGRVAVADLARLLIALERTGLAVDPMPLCRALAPNSNHGSAVGRRARGVVPFEPLMLTVAPHPELTRILLDEPDWTFSTPRGHRVDVWGNDYDDVERVALRIRPERRKARLTALAA